MKRDKDGPPWSAPPPPDPFLGLGGARGAFGGGLGSFGGQQQVNPIDAATMQKLMAQQMAAQIQADKAARKFLEQRDDPKWWVGKDVPPLEPFERFLRWIDLEIAWLNR